jgi:hypothetical protein
MPAKRASAPPGEGSENGTDPKRPNVRAPPSRRGGGALGGEVAPHAPTAAAASTGEREDGASSTKEALCCPESMVARAAKLMRCVGHTLCFLPPLEVPVATVFVLELSAFARSTAQYNSW